MKGYGHWFERFKRVLSAFKQEIITEGDLEKFQLFLLDTGQFNANFDLEELNYLGYPKSPFAMMHEKFYLREVETWAMQMLRFKYQEVYADFGQLFPIFLDSDLFWNEIDRYYRVIHALDITDVSVSSLINALEEAKDQVPVWVEINRPNQDIDVITCQNTAQKALEQKIIELVARKQNIPDILVAIFNAMHSKDPIDEEAINLPVVLEHLNQLFSQVREDLQRHFDALQTKLSSAINAQETWAQLIGLISLQCKKYKILPVECNTLKKLQDFSLQNPEAFNQLIKDLVARLQPNRLTIDSYKDAINVWNQQNIVPLFTKLSLVHYFRDNFNDVETIVLSDAEEEPEFVHRAIEHLGYRIDPIRAQHIILQTYPWLFVNAEETVAFWEEINRTSMLDELDHDERETITQLQQMVLAEIQSPPLPIISEDFSLEIERLDLVLPGLIGGFKFYAKYLKNYLEDYLQRYQFDNHLRVIVDSEIRDTLNIFLQACAAANLSDAIRAVQSISEIMLLDLNHNPLPLSHPLPQIIQTQLNGLPVQGTLVVPYGMRAFVRVFQILDAQYGLERFHAPLNIFVTSQSYYEWLGNLEGLSGDQMSVFQTQQITDIASSADIIFVELHPNNVLASKQFAFNIEALLSQMKSWPFKQKTLVIDMTLNAVNDQEIQSFLRSESALGLIDAGVLNIILIQSLTKFAQLGLDKRSAGTLTMINNNEHWSKVNVKLVELSDAERIDISTLSFFSYFANMHWPEVEYLELINRNVRFVYQEIVEQMNKLELLHSGLQVSRSSDPKPCYVAINTNGFITDFSFTSDNFREFVSDFLIHLFYPLCRFYELPITERYSIGFPLTSINPVFGSLRLTIGLEPEAQLKQYAEILAYTTFVFNDLRDERKLPLVQNEGLRREFLAEKVKIFKAMTPGRGNKHEWEFEGTGYENRYTDYTDPENIQARQLKRHVVLEDGNIKFFREAPSRYAPYHPEWTELSPRVIVRGIGEISVNDPRITAAEKRIIAGCYTSEYNFDVDPFGKTVSIQNYEVLGLWNAKFLYGPFHYNDAKLFCVLYQKKMYFYYNGQRFNEEDVIVKQATIEIVLSDIAVEDRAFLVREGYGYTSDRSIPSITSHDRFDFHMQFIPPRDKITMQFSLRGDQLIIEHDFLCCAASGVTIYYRILGDQLTCYEIDYWAEKDPIAARFLRFITAAYVKDALSLPGTNFKARNSQFTHFIFNLNHEVGAALLQEAISIITFYKESIKKALQSITLDDQQYHFYDINSFSSRQVSWPSGYSPSGADYVSNAAFIKKTLGQFGKFKIFKTHKIKSEQPIPDILTIKGDGDCIYNSILAGIKRLPAGINTDIILLDNTHIDLNTINLAQLRRIVADYIEDNQGYYFDLIAFQIADNIRHNELAGYPESMRAEMQILANAYHSRQNIQAVERNIQQFINNGIVGQYINLMRNTYDSGQEVIWGGAVELGIISEILGIQFYVYRRGGEYYHIDNTQTDNAHRVDLDYTGDHYNLVLLPAMYEESEGKMSGEGSLKLQAEYHALSPFDPFYNRYYKYGLDEMLLLRLKDANLQDVAMLPAFKLNIHTLQTTLPQITKKLDKGFDKVILPGNIEGKHWVGFLFQKTVDSLKVLYLDSELGKLAVSFRNQFIEYFQGEYQEVLMIEEVVERQKYNNCGPEVIENFIKYLGKERLPQDEAVYYHSQLLEQSLLSLSLKRFLDYDDYIMTTVPSVSYDILMLCQTSASHKQSTPVNLLPLIKDVSLEEIHPNTELSLQITNQAGSDNTGSIPNIGTNFIKRLNDYVEHYLKKIFLPDEFYEMQQLANKHKVDIKIVDEVTLKQAYKKIALKTHPDKYPDATEDFIKAKQLLDQKESPLPTELYAPIMQKLQKANIIVEAADTAIDSIRAFKDPSLENVLKVGIGCIHLASMYTGKTGVMLPIAAAGSVYQAYQGDYWEATTSMTKAIGFTLMFSTVYTTAPAVAVVLSAGFTGYATYSMLNNGYELYNEFLEPNPINDSNSNQDTFDFSF
jgi:hypothetical protein